jgi:hypothetical protein
MHLSHRLSIALLTVLICPAWALGHFLFVRILPPAEGRRLAEVFFSDRADVGDSQFVAKITGTRLWVQTGQGKFEPLKLEKGEDRLRTSLPATGSLSVIGECTYGVLARPKKTPFLLRHYPRALSGKAEEIAGPSRKAEIPFEISLRQQGEGLEFTALRDGKPIPGAVFESLATDLKGDKFTADGEGKASWKPPAAGAYVVYTSQFLKQAGEHEGKKYEEIREFATLSFTWPLR